MSTFHKGTSLLKRNSNKNLLIIFISLISLVIYFYIVFIKKLLPLNLYIILPIIIPILLILYFSKRYKILYSGVKGENLALKYVKKLPKNYHIFNNVELSYEGRKNELDLIAVGENGIFIIEVKNHKGTIIGDNYDKSWVQYKTGKKGGHYSKKFNNPIKQVKEQVYKLSKNLEQMNINSWVQGVVIFTNSEVNLDVSTLDIPVLNSKEALIDYITKFHSDYKLTTTTISKITKFLTNHQNH